MKVIGYGRVSRVKGRSGASFMSPAQQREKIEAHAAAHGWQIVEHIEDLDVSGKTIDRPGFQRALEMIENRQAQGLVVAKLDRFARTMLGAHQAIARIEAAKGTFVSVSDSFDLSTPVGRLMFNIMASFAEFELARLTVQWDEVLERNMEAGVPTGIPFGYMRGPDRRLIVDPPAADIVREIFRRSAAGDSLPTIQRWLNSKDIRTKLGGQWTRAGLVKTLSNRTYLGEIRNGERCKAETHPAIVSLADFHAAQKTRGVRAATGSIGLLSGLLRCANCRYALNYGTNRIGKKTYRCTGQHGAGKCPEPVFVLAEQVEPYVMAWAERQVHEVRVRLQGERGAPDADQLLVEWTEARVNRELHEDDDDLLRLMGRERYTAKLERLYAAEYAAEARYAEVDGAQQVDWVQKAREVQSTADKRLYLAQGIDCIFLRGRPGRGYVSPIEDRVLILGRGEGPAAEDLPRQGRRVNPYVLRPIVWNDPNN